jgi:hypothetical protein
VRAAHYEKAGRLSADPVSAFARLQTFRRLADYDARERRARGRAEAEVSAAGRFVTKAPEIVAAAVKGSV